MGKKLQQGEIATIITIGTLIILGISTLVSSVFLKNKQPTKSLAAVTCDDPKWTCADECADIDKVRPTFNAVYPPDGSDEWRAEKARNCGINVNQCDKITTCVTPAPLINPPASGCFYLSDEIYYNAGQGFTHWVKFWSPPGGGDGDIKLERNGADTGLLSGWNKGLPNTPERSNNPFVVPPLYSGENLPAGVVSYVGTASTCGAQGMGRATLTCKTSLIDGKPSVEGDRCEGKNFASAPPGPKVTTTAGPTVVPKPTVRALPKCDSKTLQNCQILGGNITLNGNPFSGQNGLYVKIIDIKSNQTILDNYKSEEWRWDQAQEGESYDFKTLLLNSSGSSAANSIIQTGKKGYDYNIDFDFTLIKPTNTPTPTPSQVPTPTTSPKEKTIKLELQFKNPCGLKYFTGATVDRSDKKFTISPDTLDSSKGKLQLGNKIFKISDNVKIIRNNQDWKGTLELTVQAYFSVDSGFLNSTQQEIKKPFDLASLQDDEIWQDHIDIDCGTITPGAAIITTPGVTTPTPGSTNYAKNVKISEFLSINSLDIKVNYNQSIIWENDFITNGGIAGRDNVKIAIPDSNNPSIGLAPGRSDISGPYTVSTNYRVTAFKVSWIPGFDIQEYILSKGKIIVLPTPTP